MKTNKQRANIILSRVNNENIDNNKDGVKNLNVTKPQSKYLSWKFLTCIGCAVLIVCGSILGLVLGLKGNGAYDIDKMYIANYKNYTAIGSGYINDVEPEMEKTEPRDAKLETKNLLLSSKSEEPSQNYLLGKKKDGSLEKISFSKIKDGNPDASQQGYVGKVMSFDDFTFFEWSKYDYMVRGAQHRNYFDNAGVIITYLIDHKTGKIFDLSKVSNEIGCIYFTYQLESDDCIYFWNANYAIKTLYKMRMENEELKIEEIITEDTLNFTDAISDRYGNIYLFNRYSSFDIAKYIITKKGNIKSLNKNIFLSVNGIAYTSDKTQKFNKNGELEENTFMNCNLTLGKGDIIKKQGNTYYYYADSYNGKLYKVTFNDYNEEFIYEVITLESYCSQYVVTQDNIYFCDDTELYTIDIKEGSSTIGKKKSIVSDYIFRTISTDNLGNVLFTAFDQNDKNRDTVNGVIYNDGKISIYKTARKYVVYSLTAVN